MKTPVPDKRTKDRRVQRTRALLHEALGSLIREKPYAAIVVKEILDRANVGRATFYSHFRDKDALLISSIHHLLEAASSSSDEPRTTRSGRALRFSLPVFEHIDRHRRTAAGRMGVRSRAILHERLRRVIAELVAEDVRKHVQGRRPAPGPLPPDLLVQYVTSSFVLVLDWWVDSGSTLSPADVNALFRALVQPSLIAALDGP